ncbi:MAG: NAD(+)/NADH kinase, partial [Acidobacteriota bacterium]|nr:NAD(+)/NADH kinase [Acidobacteriota bacterium]
MHISNCLVIVKQTALAQGGRAASLAKEGDKTAKRLLAADAEHNRTVEEVRRALRRRKITFAESPLTHLDARLKGQLAIADLVITVGGDGTALSASHYVRSGALIGINSAPGDSVGHFCSVNRKSFAARLDAILNGESKPVELARLLISLEGKPLAELALNDVLITHHCAASTTRYLVGTGNREEEQRSSGIWISTAAGSTAGIGSAGGKKMARGSRRIQYLIRELYREPNRSYQFTRGFAESGEAITIASKMAEGELYIDGARTMYPFPFGTRAQIQTAEH